MNRREAREQNDTSIIRNLPKRLQKRIVEELGDVGGSASSLSNREDGKTAKAIVTPVHHTMEHTAKTPQECTTKEREQNLPRIDLFLRMKDSEDVLTRSSSSAKATPVSEASGLLVVTAVAPEGSVEKKVDAIIPGILRLNTTDSCCLTETAKSSINRRENGRKNARQQRNGIINMHDDLHKHISPVGQVHQQQAKVLHPAWFNSLGAPYTEQVTHLHENLLMHMQRNSVLENWQDFCDTQQQLEEIFKHLLLHQLKFCCEQKVDTFFWKLLFYNVREYLKSQQSAQAAKCTLTLIEEGMQFYSDLHSQLTDKFIAGTSSKDGKERTAHKFEFIAKVAAQKLLICLGDLCRYKAKQQQMNDYTEAAKYYQQAQCLIPSNGIPYNQLAIVAIHARKKFDAIYFHMRSLMSSNAIYSARESLLVLFDEIRKKYEETELKTSPIHQSPNRHNQNMSKSLRKEVWIYPDGVRRLHRTDMANNKLLMNEENKLKEMPTDELLRRFTSMYLYVCGKLYTGTGMESILDHQRKLLIQLNMLLKQTNLPLTRSRLLKTVALNIFLIEHNKQKDARREVRYYALNFSNQMFGLILRKCNQLLNAQLENTKDFEEKSFNDLNTLLQYIKIYTDWLAQSKDIWEPIRSDDHIFIDTWTELQCLFMKILRGLNDTSDGMGNASQSILEEDIFLMGFTPLANTTPSMKHYEITSSTVKAQFQSRLEKIANFQKYFEENQRNLQFNDKSHFSFEELNPAIKCALDNLQTGNVDDDDDDDNSENIVVNGLNRSKSANDMKLTKATNVENTQMTQLSKLKKELEAKTNVKRMYSAKLEEILKFVDSKLYIEVRPKYLLPDTNCFIDCLEDFERLAKEFKHYTLIIPLTVVKELDGLSKGVKLETYEKSLQKHRIHHFDDVSTRAKKITRFHKYCKK